MSTETEEKLRQYLKRVTQRLQDTESKLHSATLGSAATHEDPIAIVAVGCHFPGAADGPEGFWDALRESRECMSPVASRWKDLPADDIHLPDCGLLTARDLAGFDARLFGIPPVLAVEMDPQQRLLLETAWETFERAGIAPLGLHGSRTGVYVGLTSVEYEAVGAKSGHDSTAYSLMGIAPSMTAGQVSYNFGLRGPSMTISTACSSSLVAIHLACQALRQRECDLALAGGVSLLVNPERTVMLARANMLAPDGRCKTFDASGDGFARAEGCGLSLLCLLSVARARGYPVLGVVRGSAVNQDGKSPGITAPDQSAQEEVIKAALANANLPPAAVQYVEAHGTGTPLGDPIELQALQATYGTDRNDDALLVGSVKSNIGHLEAAAGIAGFIKLVLSLQHEALPANMHFKTPNPNVPWEEMKLEVVKTLQRWQRSAKARVAGLSSFGFSGTNAHILVGDAPDEPKTEPQQVAEAIRPAHVLTLSGANDDAVRALARRYVSFLDTNRTTNVQDICHSAQVGRSHLGHRVAIQGTTHNDLRAKLSAYADGREVPGVAAGRVRPGYSPKIAFLFTGQGSQYVGMSRLLYETQPVFRRTLDRCAEGLAKELERPLLSVMFGEGPDGVLLDQTGYTQPALFSLGYALSEMWRSWGVEPQIVLGHSVGELTAACVAGVFDLDEGLRLIAARGRMMQALPPGGGMVSVMAPVARVAPLVAKYPSEVSIAAINGPNSVVLSGDDARLSPLTEALQAEGIKCKRLQVSHAFHSPRMEPMLDAFEKTAATISFKPPRVGLISNLSGKLVSAEDLGNARYWRRHVRDAVSFADSVESLRSSGCNVILELGPHPTLIGMAREIIEDPDIVWGGSLRKGAADWEQLLATTGSLYASGVNLDWKGYDRGYTSRTVSIPTYAFQHERYWVDGSRSSSARDTVVKQQSAKPSEEGVLRVLGDISALSPEASLADAGLDSLRVVEVKSAIRRFPGGATLARAIGPASTVREILDFVRTAAAPVADDSPSVLAKLREAEWIPVTRESVRKSHEANVFISRCATLKGDGSPPVLAAELRMNPSHAFFYEHALDHVPGLYLIEAARQALRWRSFTQTGRLEDGSLDRIDAEFFLFVEHDVPAYFVQVPGDGPLVLHLYQSDKLKGTFSITGRKVADYQAVRDTQRASDEASPVGKD